MLGNGTIFSGQGLAIFELSKKAKWLLLLFGETNKKMENVFIGLAL